MTAPATFEELTDANKRKLEFLRADYYVNPALPLATIHERAALAAQAKHKIFLATTGCALLSFISTAMVGLLFFTSGSAVQTVVDTLVLALGSTLAFASGALIVSAGAVAYSHRKIRKGLPARIGDYKGLENAGHCWEQILIAAEYIFAHNTSDTVQQEVMETLLQAQEIMQGLLADCALSDIEKEEIQFKKRKFALRRMAAETMALKTLTQRQEAQKTLVRASFKAPPSLVNSAMIIEEETEQTAVLLKTMD